MYNFKLKKTQLDTEKAEKHDREYLVPTSVKYKYTGSKHKYTSSNPKKKI